MGSRPRSRSRRAPATAGPFSGCDRHKGPRPRRPAAEVAHNRRDEGGTGGGCEVLLLDTPRLPCAGRGDLSTIQHRSMSARVCAAGRMPPARSENFASSAPSLMGTSTLPTAFSTWRATRLPPWRITVMSTCPGFTAGSTVGTTRPRSATMVGSQEQGMVWRRGLIRCRAWEVFGCQLPEPDRAFSQQLLRPGPEPLPDRGSRIAGADRVVDHGVQASAAAQAAVRAPRADLSNH